MFRAQGVQAVLVLALRAGASPDSGAGVKAFIPSYGRSQIIRTHLLFPGNYCIVVHTEEERQRYSENASVDASRVIVSGVLPDRYGLINQRQWVLDNCVALGEWIIFAVDNIKHIEIVSDPFYQELELPISIKKQVTMLDTVASRSWYYVFRAVASPWRIHEVCKEMACRAENQGTVLAGLASYDNPGFRTKHWRDVAFVTAPLYLQNNDGKRYDQWFMEDHYRTAEALLQYGSVLVNQYAYARRSYYSPIGGHGNYQSRVPILRQETAQLIERYQGLFRSHTGKKRRDFVPGTEPVLALRTREQIDAWRQTFVR